MRKTVNLFFSIRFFIIWLYKTTLFIQKRNRIYLLILFHQQSFCFQLTDFRVLRQHLQHSFRFYSYHIMKKSFSFPLHFPFFFHHSYFFLFTRPKSTDKNILFKVIVYPVPLQTRFSLIILYCLTNSNFPTWFKSSNHKYFSQTYPSQFLLLHKNSYKTSFLKSYSFAIDNITLYF